MSVSNVLRRSVRSARSISLSGATLVLCLPSMTQAATLIPIVPYPGSTGTAVLGINNNNIITGPWSDSNGVGHGYFGTLAGNDYTSFDYTGHTANSTFPRGINDNNIIVGYGPTDGSGRFVVGPEFEYHADKKKMDTITQNGVPLDGVAQAVNDAGMIGGDYLADQGSVEVGWLGQKAKWQEDLNVFGSTGVAPRATNKSGVVVGGFEGSDGLFHGFILQNGTARQVDYPDPNVISTGLEGINDKGVVAGFWEDSDGSISAFYLDTNSNTFHQIQVKGSSLQQAFGINNAGLIAVVTDIGSYVYCPRKPAKCPQSASAEEIPDEPGMTVPAGARTQNLQRRSAILPDEPRERSNSKLPLFR